MGGGWWDEAWKLVFVFLIQARPTPGHLKVPERCLIDLIQWGIPLEPLVTPIRAPFGVRAGHSGRTQGRKAKVSEKHADMLPECVLSVAVASEYVEERAYPA